MAPSLVRLENSWIPWVAGLKYWRMPGTTFDEAFGGFSRPVGRPAKPTRLMVGLHYLKHVHDLSDEETVDALGGEPLHQA